MKILATMLGAAVASIALTGAALGQEVTLRLHHFLPAQATIPAKAITPWTQKIEQESGGRIKFELYPAMQLGGGPPNLYDQAKDGVVDVIWTVLGYAPGRFPKSEVFEMPFMVTTGEATSVAFQEFVEANTMDEFEGVKLIAVHTHGPGLFHTKSPIAKLEDLGGMKVRGGSRVISDMLTRLGAEAIGMPVPATTEALSKGVIDGTTIPWEVAPSIRTSEMVTNHTGFAGTNGLYTQTFALVMNQASYDKLPDDLKAVIDNNSGTEVAALFGRVMDEGDIAGRKQAEGMGNAIVTLDETETARWKAAAQATIDQWLADVSARGIDGEALYDSATALVAKHTK